MSKNNQPSCDIEKNVLYVAGLGMFLSTLDSGIMNVALPSLQTLFHTNTLIISWTISFYLIAITACIISFGKMGDHYGRLKIFRFGLVIFFICSLLCGLANNIVLLIILRTFQGIGAAMMQATAAALITTLLPDERKSFGLGMLVAILGFGPILGPIIAGFAISWLSWKWIFWINIPVCFFVLQRSFKIHDTSLYRTLIFKNKVTFLLLPCIISTSMLGLVLISLNLTLSTCLFLLSAILLTVLMIRNIKLFVKERFFLIMRSLFTGFFATFTFGFSTAIILMLPPFFLEKTLAMAPWKIGFYSLCAPIGIILSARYSSFFVKKFGSKTIMLVGLCSLVVTLLLLAVTLNEWLFSLPLLLFFYGLGGGLFQPANQLFLMNKAAANQQGTMGATHRMIHNLGNMVGLTVAATLIELPLSQTIINHQSFQQVLITAIILLILASFGLYCTEDTKKLNV